MVCENYQPAPVSLRRSSKPKNVLGGTFLVAFGARSYNSALGRWINRDPVGEQGGVNIYGFVGNQATTNVDLIGLQKTKTPICKIHIYLGHAGSPYLGRWIDKMTTLNKMLENQGLGDTQKALFVGCWMDYYNANYAKRYLSYKEGDTFEYFINSDGGAVKYDGQNPPYVKTFKRKDLFTNIAKKYHPLPSGIAIEGTKGLFKDLTRWGKLPYESMSTATQRAYEKSKEQAAKMLEDECCEKVLITFTLDPAAVGFYQKYETQLEGKSYKNLRNLRFLCELGANGALGCHKK